MISAIVLTGGKIDRRLLDKCLKSLSWTDEIIQIKKDKGTFFEWRNEGARLAKGDWILYVDADEEVIPELKKNILEVVGSDEFSAYAIPRRNFIFGKEFKHSGQWPGYVKRLFLKSKFKGWKGELHEEPMFDGIMGHLKQPLIHRKDISISEMVDKTNQWSEIEARLMFEAHHPKMNFFRFFSAGLREFWLRMIVQVGFLDGVEGVIYAIYQVFSRLVSYSKLWEMQIKSKL
jgi:hypothetical protein